MAEISADLPSLAISQSEVGFLFDSDLTIPRKSAPGPARRV
jgi:hypothetical protein